MGKNYTTSYEEDHSQHDMSKKENIVKDWLPRYTGRKLEDFGEFILLTNFIGYVEKFAERFDVEVHGRDKPMQTARAHNLLSLTLLWEVLWLQLLWICFGY